MSAKPAIPTAPPPSRQELDEAREREERRAGWAFIWVLVGFKLATVVAILVAARTEEAVVLVTATTWFWLPIPVVAFGGTLLFRWRLHRVRRRRNQLRRAEWQLGDERADQSLGLP
jgi:hypothetical protein